VAAAVTTTPVEPTWLGGLLGAELPAEGGRIVLRGTPYLRRGGMLRAEALVSATQAQTRESFGFKWQKRETFESAASLERMRGWLLERYGDVVRAPWWRELGPNPVVVDAGCGAAMSSIELFGDALAGVRYLGVDISAAVDVARARFAERGLPGAFLQADLTALPLADGSVDLILAEGVLHHADSTERALKELARQLRCGGRFLFYVYRTKGPIREFTDDHLRASLAGLPPEVAWDKLMPLTRLGKLLGDLDVVLDIPEPIDLLGIPAGPISLQRFFYWHVAKAFHHPELDLDELNHINFDWYAPVNAHRQSPAEVQRWCGEAGLVIEREIVEPAGITVIARKAGGQS
jgi:arsenite methyltransferase